MANRILDKVFRANLRTLDAVHFIGLNSETMATRHQDLFLDILRTCKQNECKPVKSELLAAVNRMYEESPKDDRTRFVDSLWITLLHCKEKASPRRGQPPSSRS